jgi:hypothetical protein
LQDLYELRDGFIPRQPRMPRGKKDGAAISSAIIAAFFSLFPARSAAIFGQHHRIWPKNITSNRDQTRMSSRSQVPSVRNDHLKMLHAMLLAEFRSDLVAAFWGRNLLQTQGRTLPLNETLEHIWDEKKKSPVAYVMHVFDKLEPFLSEHHRSALEFANILYSKSASMGSMASAQKMLSYIEPVIPDLFKKRDLRHFLLENLASIHKLVLPGIQFRLVKHISEGEWFTAIAMHIMDARFERDLPYFDGELFLGIHLKWLPRGLGLPPFEKVFPMADCRGIEKIVDPALLQISGDRVMIKGEEVGRLEDFHDFCNARLVHLDDPHIPRRTVAVMHRDYFGPKRRRVVLHRQCCYGAPVYLNRIVYKKSAEGPENPLSVIIRNMDDPGFWNHAEELHRALLESTRPSMRLVYHGKKGSMTMNGRRLVRGIPAKILRKVLIAHGSEKQKVFQHKDFKNDSQVIAEAYDSNFVIRLQRLMSTLEKKAPALAFTKSAPGEFIFVPSASFSYVEEE